MKYDLCFCSILHVYKLFQLTLMPLAMSYNLVAQVVFCFFVKVQTN